jgi:single-strand DNA-binding protein
MAALLGLSRSLGGATMNGITMAATGRLGQGPEQRYTNSGKLMLSFSIAVDEKTTATEDRAAVETTWVRVTCWEELAETLSEQLRKGTQVYVEGRQRLARWTGKDGAPRAGLSVSAWRVDVHGQIGKGAPRREREPAEATAW